MKKIVILIFALILILLFIVFKPELNKQVEQSDEYWNCMKECVNDPNYPDGWGPPDDGTVSSNPFEQECISKCEEFRIIE